MMGSGSWLRVLAALSSGLLMAVPFLDARLLLLTWLALVPLLWAMEGAGLLRTYGLGLAAGLVFSMVAGYWAAGFMIVARDYSPVASLLVALVLWLASAQVIALAALLINGLRRLPLHDFLIVPAVVALVYGLVPVVFPFHPADTQSAFPVVLQPIAITGIAGLDGLIGLVNVMVYRLLPFGHGPARSRAAWLAASLLVACWFGYGLASFQLWDARLAEADSLTLGIVQPNEPAIRHRPHIYPGYSLAYPPEMEMTRRLAEAGAELVIWPETRFKGYFDTPAVQAAYARKLAAADTRLLFHDTETVGSRQYNAALMIGGREPAPNPYRKMKTMPFGEALPLGGALPLLNRLTRRVFGDFLTRMNRGTEHVRFPLGNLDVVPLICYETLFPGFVREAVARAGASTLLVALSNNAWFGATVQPRQHARASILRAVENRVPFVHALNNGPSMVVLPNGRVLFESPFRQAGGYLVDVPIVHGKADSLAQ